MQTVTQLGLVYSLGTEPVYSSVPDPYVFGLPGSTSGSVSHKYGSGSFPFLIKVLSGRVKYWLQNKILLQKCKGTGMS